MSQENRVSLLWKAEAQTKIDQALDVVKSTLKPYFVTISAAERQQLPKMSDKSTPFVRKVLEYAQSNAEFMPAFVLTEELKKDVEAFEALQRVAKKVEGLLEELTDTLMVAGSEAYVASLAYYNAVKQGVKQNVPSAKTIYEDLKVRFEGQGTPKSPASGTN